MFKSRTNKPETIAAPTGRKFANEYAMQINEKGHKTLQKVGETNVYEKIQAGLEDTLIENILTRAAMGDSKALNRIQGNYLDCTEMPETLADAQNRILLLKSDFDKLPVELRREYNFSAEEFVADVGSTKWNKLMGLTKPEVITPVEGKPEIVTPEVVTPEVTEK